jgi:alkylation response protein AidB-like acyl-CoA dehydrogenase
MVDLALSDTQQELQLVARRFLAARRDDAAGDGRGSGPGRPPALWQEMADLGWLGLLIPPELGGGGALPFDAGALYQELGRRPLPVPLFESAVLAPAAMLALDGSGGAFATALGRIAAGTAAVAPVLSSTSAPPLDVGEVSLRLSDRRPSGGVRGRARWVRHAACATEYLVLARTEQDDPPLACALVDAADSSVTLNELPGFAPGQFEVTFDDAPVVGTPVFLGPDRLAALVGAMILALPVLCAFQVGSCQAVLDMTVAYSGDRVAFGKPIGTFQRVQDHVIEIADALDAARWTTYHALWRAGTGDGARAACHVAKAVTSEAHAAACTHSHEVHAGIGTDLHYGLAAHTRLARTLYGYYGDPLWHRQMLATELGIR